MTKKAKELPQKITTLQLNQWISIDLNVVKNLALNDAKKMEEMAGKDLEVSKLRYLLSRRVNALKRRKKPLSKEFIEAYKDAQPSIAASDLNDKVLKFVHLAITEVQTREAQIETVVRDLSGI